MNAHPRYQTIFFSIVFACMAVLTILVFWPFLVPLALAAIIAVMIHPVYEKIHSKIRSESAAAGISIVLLIVLILTPLTFVASRIIQEAQGLYSTLSAGSAGGSLSIDFLTTKVDNAVQQYVPDFQFNAREYLAGFSSWLVDRLGGLFSGTLDFGLKIALTFVALFYFLRDGAEFKKQIMLFSPLSDDKDRYLTQSLKASINSVILGSLAVAVVQGILSGIGFSIFGLPNATLWGTAAGLAALVPGVGTSLVWIPAVIYLYFYGSSGIWIGELLWSMFLVGLIDNFLAPFIINKGVNIHPLLILFSILGGLQFFGPEGFILGPLVVSLLFTFIKISKADEK